MRQRISTSSETANNLVVTRVLVAPLVLGSIFVGANILRFNGVVPSVAGNVTVNSEAPVVNSSVSRCADISFGGVHRGRLYVRVFIGVSVRTC